MQYNLFAYTYFDPINYIDYDGHEALALGLLEMLQLIIAGIGGVISAPEIIIGVVIGVMAVSAVAGIVLLEKQIDKTNESEKNKKKQKDKSKAKDIKKVDEKYLEQKGIDEHELKQDALHKKTGLSKYDIYIHNGDTSKELYVYRKGGKGIGIPTGVHLR